MYIKYHYLFVIGISIIVNISSTSCFPEGRTEPTPPSGGIEECPFAHQFRSGNECYPILQKGRCKDDEWFVMKKENSSVDWKTLKPVCEKKLCTKIGEFWWPKTAKCIDWTTIKSTHCNYEDVYVGNNLFGEGVCHCIPNIHHETGAFQDGNSCYEYYKRGPCKNDEVVVYDVPSGYATCEMDKCREENRNSERTHVYYAPLEGTGKCYILGSRGPCKENYVYKIASLFHIPKCAHAPNPVLPSVLPTFINAPELCQTEGDKCKDSVKINNNQQFFDW